MLRTGCCVRSVWDVSCGARADDDRRLLEHAPDACVCWSMPQLEQAPDACVLGHVTKGRATSHSLVHQCSAFDAPTSSAAMLAAPQEAARVASRSHHPLEIVLATLCTSCGTADEHTPPSWSSACPICTNYHTAGEHASCKRDDKDGLQRCRPPTSTPNFPPGLACCP